ncbi:MAG TPA: chromate resistance protein ChrB domain-containing protein [Candidatus Dormibacteraeota bacterium]|nr:chromate resistance protein ChrB domain-containing protein [Candidatus Dormibacteraeota bacterium]
MKWITREKIRVDRAACPWLIKQFVDRDAEFVFLSHNTNWAKIYDGVVFDVPNCELGHHGEDVSFNSILKKYKLTDSALILLGEIVRVADSRPAMNRKFGSP